MNEPPRLIAPVWLVTILLLLLPSGCCHVHHNPSHYDTIHAAVRAGDVAAVKAEIAHDPDSLNRPDDHGLTPLHLAASQCQTKVLVLLLKRNAAIEARGPQGARPLHLGAQEGCTNAVAVLLKRGAAVNARDDEGRTPLKRAELWGQEGIAALLRLHGGVE